MHAEKGSRQRRVRGTAPEARGRPAVLALAWCLCLAGAAEPVRAQRRFVRCDACHPEEARQFAESVHRGVVRCQECHGGQDGYELTPEELRQFTFPAATSRAATTVRPQFDHKSSFRGNPPRAEVPVLCGACHADVEKMNAYGLRTDQLAAYWVSGHGKRLKNEGDERVAVCVDCHGTHDVLRHDSPSSRTHFRRIPDTCGRCHADANLMNRYNIPADIVEQYRRSVHGRNVLERGDPGSPNCATCHGNHAAAPPGYLEVSHVCGQCHKQIEDYFLSSVHGRLPVMARCIGCHAKGGERYNHEIAEASVPAERLPELYDRLRASSGESGEALRKPFDEAVAALSGHVQLGSVCRHCHGAARRDPHAMFFEGSDRVALEYGAELDAALRDAQWEYARAAAHVARLGRGVLLVQDEALRVEDAKTEVMALYSFIHTLNRVEAQSRTQKVREICQEIHAALDAKERGLRMRRGSLAPVWGLGLVFAVLMYRKYLALRQAYVRPGPGDSTAVAVAAAGPREVLETVPSPGRRRALDAVLAFMGATFVFGLIWPAVSYVLPVRKRGGGSERASAGKEGEWDEWAARKVSVRGRPVVVLRTDKGFRAFSAVCTHLGCIVHWNAGTRAFECPCHAATFDAAGKVVSGPPPRPLPEYGVSVVQGEVIIKAIQEG